MCKAKQAETWILRELRRGLPVYLFEVADFMPFDNARKLMRRLEIDGMARRDDCGQHDRPRWEKGRAA